ncbi:fungal hydrophobin [Cubamyces sp. BRFM 1775]|nr:fungal hydrophobin [Cubamyces sp. BRFM 1775]
MQFFATLTTLVLAFAGAASAVPYYASQSQCSSGSMQCCNNVQSADSPSLLDALKLLDLADQLNADTNVGTSCTPINAVGAGGTESCTAMPVCCDGNTFGGLSFGCSPIAAIL